jgi:hypothetical protein
VIGVDSGAEKFDRTIDSMFSVLERRQGPFFPLHPLNSAKGVFIFLATARPDNELRAFFAVLEPLLEMYRASTIHTLNDLYRTREDDLADIVKKMTALTEGTLRALLDYITTHPVSITRRHRLGSTRATTGCSSLP